MNVLNSIENKTAEWYFLRSNIYLRKGQRSAAIADARAAAAMAPGNMNYQQYLYSLEYQSDWYNQTGTQYGRRTVSFNPCDNICLTLGAVQLLHRRRRIYVCALYMLGGIYDERF